MFSPSDMAYTKVECPNCKKRNSYSYRENKRAEAYGYYTCKHCGAEYDEYGLVDKEKDND